MQSIKFKYSLQRLIYISCYVLSTLFILPVFVNTFNISIYFDIFVVCATIFVSMVTFVNELFYYTRYRQSFILYKVFIYLCFSFVVFFCTYLAYKMYTAFIQLDIYIYISFSINVYYGMCYPEMYLQFPFYGFYNSHLSSWFNYTFIIAQQIFIL